MSSSVTNNSANLTKSIETNLNSKSNISNIHLVPNQQQQTKQYSNNHHPLNNINISNNISQQQQQQQQVLQNQNISHQQIFTNFIAAAGKQHQNNQRSQDRVSNMPKNEPVKLVYPTSQASNIVTMNNNRVTFTTSTAPVQNGTITLSPMTANQLTQPNQQQQATVMQQRAAGGQQAPTLIFKNTNSSAPGTLITTPVTVTKNSQVR